MGADDGYAPGRSRERLTLRIVLCRNGRTRLLWWTDFGIPRACVFKTLMPVVGAHLHPRYADVGKSLVDNRTLGVGRDRHADLVRSSVCAGLVHRWNELVSPSRAAVCFHQITQPPDAGSEYERRHEHSVLELLLSAASETPLSEQEIRRALGTSKKKRKLAVVDALSRLDRAGLVDRRGDLAVASTSIV